jgi:hypothetical protein
MYFLFNFIMGGLLSIIADIPGMMSNQEESFRRRRPALLCAHNFSSRRLSLAVGSLVIQASISRLYFGLSNHPRLALMIQKSLLQSTSLQYGVPLPMSSVRNQSKLYCHQSRELHTPQNRQNKLHLLYLGKGGC